MSHVSILPDAIDEATARAVRTGARYTRYALLDRGSYEHAPAEVPLALHALVAAAIDRPLAIADARFVRLVPGDYVLAHHDPVSEREELEVIADLSPGVVTGADVHYRRDGNVFAIVSSRPRAVSIVVRDPRVTCHHAYVSKRHAPTAEVVRLVVRLRAT